MRRNEDSRGLSLDSARSAGSRDVLVMNVEEDRDEGAEQGKGGPRMLGEVHKRG